jgi:hypothetical protein
VVRKFSAAGLQTPSFVTLADVAHPKALSPAPRIAAEANGIKANAPLATAALSVRIRAHLLLATLEHYPASTTLNLSLCLCVNDFTLVAISEVSPFTISIVALAALACSFASTFSSHRFSSLAL